jgi:hypothetical protein
LIGEVSLLLGNGRDFLMALFISLTTCQLFHKYMTSMEQSEQLKKLLLIISGLTPRLWTVWDMTRPEKS